MVSGLARPLALHGNRPCRLALVPTERGIDTATGGPNGHGPLGGNPPRVVAGAEDEGVVEELELAVFPEFRHEHRDRPDGELLRGEMSGHRAERDAVGAGVTAAVGTELQGPRYCAAEGQLAGGRGGRRGHGYGECGNREYTRGEDTESRDGWCHDDPPAQPSTGSRNECPKHAAIRSRLLGNGVPKRRAFGGWCRLCLSRTMQRDNLDGRRNLPPSVGGRRGDSTVMSPVTSY